MSQARSSGCQDDADLQLALAFEGLQITVQGPKAKALSLVQRVTAELSTESTIPEVPTAVPAIPGDLSILAGKLSAASCLSPAERIQRAWVAGHHARAAILGKAPPRELILPIDLPSKFFAVAQGSGLQEPKILRSTFDFKQALKPAPGVVPVGHEFPSETEAIVYLAAAKTR